jgi:hypothetical protein
MLYRGHETMGAFFGCFSHPNIAMVTITFVISMALVFRGGERDDGVSRRHGEK